MGIGLPGEDFNSMWGTVFNVSAALEAAVNCGNVIGRDFHIPNIGKADSIEQLYENFETAARRYMRKTRKSAKDLSPTRLYHF